MIRISTSRRGTMVRARGKDAQRLLEAFSRVVEEKSASQASAKPTTTTGTQPKPAKGDDHVAR
jgi:hypothetical protein